MEAVIDYIKDVQFKATVGKHTVICDQPKENSGADEGMSPPDFLLVSLGTCAGYYAAQYLRARSLPTAGLQIFVSAVKELGPARLASFRIEVRTQDLDPRHEEPLLRSVKSCLIHNTLAHAPAIEIAVCSTSLTR